MCTGLTLTTKDGYHFFGRTMDVEYVFGQKIYLMPRNYLWTNIAEKKEVKAKYAVLGMGTILKDHLMFTDALNEHGLACAGLNFPGYAYYEESLSKENINLGPYDIILWILSNFKDIKEVKANIQDINIVNIPVSENIPTVPLHWIVADKNGECIVIEKTKEKLSIFDNNIGVLTNSPTFDWHTTNLRHYMGIESTQPIDTVWEKENLTPLGQGIGGIGLPGDFSPASRFIRAAFFKSHIALAEDESSGVMRFFNILNNVNMVSGAVITREGKVDITQYTSCMCQEKGIYYYNTFNNNQINAIDMFKEDLDSNEVKSFSYIDKQSINYQN